MKKQSKFKYETTAPEPFHFEKQNDELTGLIIEIGLKVIRGTRVPYIIVETEEGIFHELLVGQYGLKQKMYSQDWAVGDEISIIYDGESESIGRAGNKLKKFQVGIIRTHKPSKKVSDINKNMVVESDEEIPYNVDHIPF